MSRVQKGNDQRSSSQLTKATRLAPQKYPHDIGRLKRIEIEAYAKSETSTMISPPPRGVGIEWELRSLGTSNRPRLLLQTRKSATPTADIANTTANNRNGPGPRLLI